MPTWKPVTIRAKTKDEAEEDFQGWEFGENDPLPIASFLPHDGPPAKIAGPGERRLIHRASGYAVVTAKVPMLTWYRELLLESPLDWTVGRDELLAAYQALPKETAEALAEVMQGRKQKPLTRQEYNLPVGAFDAKALAKALPVLPAGAFFRVLDECVPAKYGKDGTSVANLGILHKMLFYTAKDAVILCDLDDGGGYRARLRHRTGCANVRLPLGFSTETQAAVTELVAEARAAWEANEPVTVAAPPPAPEGAARVRDPVERPEPSARAPRPSYQRPEPKQRVARVKPPPPPPPNRQPLREGLPLAAVTPLATLSGVPGLEGWDVVECGFALPTHDLEIARCDGGWWWREVGGAFVTIGTGIPFTTPKLCLYWLQRSYVPEWRTGKLDDFIASRAA